MINKYKITNFNIYAGIFIVHLKYIIKVKAVLTFLDSKNILKTSLIP